MLLSKLRYAITVFQWVTKTWKERERHACSGSPQVAHKVRIHLRKKNTHMLKCVAVVSFNQPPFQFSLRHVNIYCTVHTDLLDLTCHGDICFCVFLWEWKQRHGTECVTQVRSTDGCYKKDDGAGRNASEPHNSPYFTSTQQTCISWLLFTHPFGCAHTDWMYSGSGKNVYLLLHNSLSKWCLTHLL